MNSNSEIYLRIDIFRVKSVFLAFMHIAFDRFWLARDSNIKFFRLLGTGTGRTFTSKDADLKQWVVLTTWLDLEQSRNFNSSSLVKSWVKNCQEHASLISTTIISKGSWVGREPFGEKTPKRVDGPVLSITRARIKSHMWRKFQREVPPVSTSLHSSPGLVTAIGIGEAPIGLQGTLSIWRSNLELTEFAQRGAPHRKVINQTHALNWYSEELFARFAIKEVHGSLHGVPLDQELRIS